MTKRTFEHANNPGFECMEAVVLLPFGRRSFLPEIVEAWGGREVVLDETTDRIVYELAGAPAPLTLIYSGMGSPAAANALEMAVAAGARRLVVFGACGGVAQEVKVGDLVIASGAVRGEGTSAYYAPPGYPAAFDPLLSEKLWRLASDSTSEIHRGVVFTTDAGYRQGPEIYEDCAGLVIAVESECSAVAVAGARLGLATAALLFCTDNVTLPDREDQGYRGLADPRVRKGFDNGLDVAIRVLCDGVK